MIFIIRLNASKSKKIKKLSICIIPALAAFFNVIIILFPKTSLLAAGEGLMLWFNRVVPSLLPFLIGTSLLNSLGMCSFFGVLFSPFMNKVFKISGEGAYALAIGLSSGSPLGAKTVAELRQSGQLTQNEAQRLVGFANNSGPLFIVGTVASAMLMNPKVGYIILLIHYLSAMATGVFLSLFRSGEKSYKSAGKGGFKAALRAMIIFREKNKKPFGEILSQSIKSSVEAIAQIGGFIVLFSVVSKIIMLFAGKFITSNYIKGIIMAVIEITNGCVALSEDKSPFSVCIIAAAISWGGLSIHSQSIAMFSKTDLNAGAYILSKLFQSAAAFLISLLFLPLIKVIMQTKQSFYQYEPSALGIFKGSALSFLAVSGAMIFMPLIISALAAIFKRYKN